MAEWHAHMGSTLWRESAPELNVFKPQLADSGAGTQPQPRLHHTAALDGRDPKPSLQKQPCTQCAQHLPWAGAGTRHFSQPGSPTSSSPSITTRHHCPSPTFPDGSWNCFLASFVPLFLPLGSAPFPALHRGAGLLRRIFLLWWQMHAVELRGWSTPPTRKCSDSRIPAVWHSEGAATQPSLGQHWRKMIITGKALVLQSRCIIYDLMIAHWLAGIIHSWRCFWVNERALTSLLSRPCSSEAISRFLSAP